MKPKEQFNQKLLVEGNDDQHVIWALCQKFKIPHNFDVIDTKGISNLFDQIPGRLVTPNLETIGIIIDADTDLATRWNQLKSKLSPDITNLPDEFSTDGLIHQNEDEIKIGVWIMPDNNLNGMLEDFISFLIPPEDSLLLHVQQHLKNIEKESLNKYKPIHKSKALIHAWLALQENPGTPMGLAITKRYLTTDATNCDKLINWLNNLFNK